MFKSQELQSGQLELSSLQMTPIHRLERLVPTNACIVVSDQLGREEDRNFLNSSRRLQS